MNCDANIHFRDGAKVTRVEKATYLGGVLTENGSRTEELNSRFGKNLANL